MNTSVHKASSNNRRILNDISTRRIVSWTCWVTRKGNRRQFARDCSVQKFVEPEPSLGVCTQNIKRKIQHCVDYQHLAMRRGPSGTQRQARNLFSDPSPTTSTKTRLLPCDRRQSRVVIGLLTGHSTLRRYLHSTGLINNSLYRRRGTEEVRSVHRNAYQG
jgi:hypothetical protein